jgi:hypothetical protein
MQKRQRYVLRVSIADAYNEARVPVLSEVGLLL